MREFFRCGIAHAMQPIVCIVSTNKNASLRGLAFCVKQSWHLDQGLCKSDQRVPVSGASYRILERVPAARGGLQVH